MTNLTNQRQVFVEEYVRSGDHLEAAKKAGYKDTHNGVTTSVLIRREVFTGGYRSNFSNGGIDWGW